MKRNMFFYWSAFVAGVMLTIFFYQAYVIYTLQSTVANDHATITQVVSFINSQMQASEANSGISQSAETSNNSAPTTSSKS